MENAEICTPEEQAILDALRMRGFAVVVFNPSELKNADSQDVEDRLTELGWETIGYLQ